MPDTRPAPDGGATGCTLITGAAGGIGAAVADRLASSADVVALLDVDEEALWRVQSTVEARGAKAATFTADISDPDAIERTVARIEHTCGPIRALAHAAGVLDTGAVVDTGDDTARRLVDVNVIGLLNVLRAVGGRMRDRRAGVIVVIGSNAAGTPRFDMGVYGATKAAAEMLTRVAGLELAEYGVRANLVAPGSTDTPMLRSMYADDRTMLERSVRGDPTRFRVGIPLGRIAEPSDIAAAVDFLLSDDARHITMQTLYVDGGASFRA